MSLATLATRATRRALDVLLIVLIACVLAMLFLSRGLSLVTGGSTFVVGGGSMEPTIPLGSIVHSVPLSPADLRVGDIVSLRTGPERAVFTHRIVRLATLPDGVYIETKGDANETTDPSLVPATDVVGRVGLSIPWIGFGVALLSTIQGALFLISFAGVLLAGAWLLESIEDEQRERFRRRAREAVAAMSPDSAPETGTA